MENELSIRALEVYLRYSAFLPRVFFLGGLKLSKATFEALG